MKLRTAPLTSCFEGISLFMLYHRRTTDFYCSCKKIKFQNIVVFDFCLSHLWFYWISWPIREKFETHTHKYLIPEIIPEMVYIREKVVFGRVEHDFSAPWFPCNIPYQIFCSPFSYLISRSLPRENHKLLNLRQFFFEHVHLLRIRFES